MILHNILEFIQKDYSIEPTHESLQLRYIFVSFFYSKSIDL
jgi:hypothetical protein